MEISKKASTYIRGICAITVLASHLISYSGFGKGSVLISLIEGMMGYLPVAIFFFLSGYGLMVSYQAKGMKYIDSMPSKRILPYYVKYLIVALVYFLVRLVCGIENESGLLIRTFLYGGTIVKFGWYLQTQLLLYFIFYFGFMLCAKKPIVAISGLTVLFWVLCVLFCLDTTYYMTTPSFLLGVFWPTIMDKPLLKKWGGGWSIVPFIGIWLLATPFDEPINAYIRCGVAPLFLIISIVWLIRKTNLESPMMGFLGRYSYEIYVLQGIVILILQSRMLNIRNPITFIVIGFSLTILLSVPGNKSFSVIDGRLKKTEKCV